MSRKIDEHELVFGRERLDFSERIQIAAEIITLLIFSFGIYDAIASLLQGKL